MPLRLGACGLGHLPCLLFAPALIVGAALCLLDGDCQLLSWSTWKCRPIQSGSSADSSGDGWTADPGVNGWQSLSSSTLGAYTAENWSKGRPSSRARIGAT